MSQYATLQSSIASAVDEYESYKAQALRTNFDSISLGPTSPKSIPSHAKRASLSIPALTRLGSKETVERPRNDRVNSHDHGRVQRSNTRSDRERPRTERFNSSDSTRPQQPTGEFSAFISVARDHENATYLIDLEFLGTILDFIRSEHPYTSNSLKTAIKNRQVQKKKLWMKYTSQMQGLAKSYAAGQTLPTPSPFDAASTHEQTIKDRKRECKALCTKLEPAERTCGESLISALEHFHAQAIKDIDARYAMRDPISDKTTPVEKHNERVRVFNQLVKFVKDDLGRLERDARTSQGEVMPSSKKDKKGSGAVDAVESLCVDDYPPYK